MAMEFGWWRKDPEEGKYQVLATVHGGNVTWTRKQGHHKPWTSHKPTDEDWDRLVSEAATRVPRRLISSKQFEEIRRLRDG